jgi:hypothetical protein
MSAAVTPPPTSPKKLSMVTIPFTVVIPTQRPYKDAGITTIAIRKAFLVLLNSSWAKTKCYYIK